MGRDAAGSVPEKVFVLKYDHKHGADLNVYPTAKAAEIGAAHLMLEWIAYLCDGEDLAVAGEILDLIEKGENAEAMQLWPKLAGDTEYITVEGVGFYPNPPEVTGEDVEGVREDITPSGDDGEGGA